MKFTNWQLVAILGVLMAAIVCTYRFAQPEVALVTSMATTLFSALFIEREKPAPAPINNLVVLPKADPPAPAPEAAPKDGGAS